MDVANLVLLVVATIAAVVGAVFAFRADVFTRRSSRQVSAQREADMQPRLDAEWGGSQGYPMATVSFRNAGGAATRFVWVGQHDAGVFVASGTVPQHAPMVDIRALKIGDATYQTGICTTLLIAEDVQGSWWDCRTENRLRHSPEEYLTARMAQVGLANFTDGLLALALRPRLPTDYVG